MCATDKGWACDWWARYTRKRVVPCLEAAARPTLVRLFNGDGRLDAVAINLVLKAPEEARFTGSSYLYRIWKFEQCLKMGV